MSMYRSQNERQMPWLIVLLVAFLLVIVLAWGQAGRADTFPLPAGEPINAGPLGPLNVQGMLSGMAFTQSNATSAEYDQHIEVDNAQLIVTKATGPLRFLVQGGGYTFPVVGEPIADPSDVAKSLYGPVPIAYLQWVPSENFSLQFGKLASLLGAEGAWPWGNVNVQRGLLWNLENAITRGAQLNYSSGKFSTSLAWTDGFYSDHYENITALFSYAATSNDSFSAAIYYPFRTTSIQSSATPVALNNANIYNLIYSHTQGSWVFQPYLQYDVSPASSELGFTHENSVLGAALLVDYRIDTAWSVGGRIEYLRSSGNDNNSLNSNLLGYGSGSHTWSLTLTPTWQEAAVFVRAEYSYVRIGNGSASLQFGAQGNDATQMRILLESGVMF